MSTQGQRPTATVLRPRRRRYCVASVVALTLVLAYSIAVAAPPAAQVPEAIQSPAPAPKKSGAAKKSDAPAAKAPSSASPAVTAPLEEIKQAAPPPFSFLGVDKDSDLDTTRKRDFEEYTTIVERSCIGCFCAHAYGDQLNESFNELYGFSAAFKSAWDSIGPCISPELNTVPQLRSLALAAKYDDLPYKKIMLFFSEFTKKPIAFRLEAVAPKTLAAALGKEFGEPENIKNIWYVWKNGNDLMVYDSYNFLYRQHPTAKLYVYFMDNYSAHLKILKQRSQTPIK